MPEQDGTGTIVDDGIRFKGGEQANHYIDLEPARLRSYFDGSSVFDLTDSMTGAWHRITISTSQRDPDTRRRVQQGEVHL
ncbi:MAG TPA: hypothetical protein VF182_00865 [Candidatus Binatia bacterium]